MSTSHMKVAQLDSVRESRIRELEKELKVQVLALHPETQQAHLSKEQMGRLEMMEMELGVTLVAYESNAAMRLARPSAEQLKRISAVEKELGLVFVAYEMNRQELTAAHYVSEQEATPAKLSDKQYKKLQAVEAETALTLMAYTRAK
ncbi:MAG TPA: hypothetical protein VF088_01925 [Pyrinomonadaceae bacterium]